MAGGFSIVLTARDQASNVLARVNRNLAQLAASSDRFRSQLGRFQHLAAQVSGLNAVSGAVRGLGGAVSGTLLTVGRFAPALSGLTAALSLAGAGAALGRWGQYGVQMERTAARTRASAEELETWQNAARLSGADAEDASQAIQTLNDNITNAAGGRAGNLEPFWKMLGIDYRDQATGQLKTWQELLPQIVQGMENLENPAMRATVGTNLLGGSFDKLAKLFRTRSGMDAFVRDAERLGNSTAGSAAVAERFARAQAEVGIALRGVGQIVAVQVAPSLTRLLSDLAGYVAARGPEIRRWMEEVGAAFRGWVEGGGPERALQSVVAFGRGVAGTARDVGDAWRDVKAVWGDLQEGWRQAGAAYREFSRAMTGSDDFTAGMRDAAGLSRELKAVGEAAGVVRDVFEDMSKAGYKMPSFDETLKELRWVLNLLQRYRAFVRGDDAELKRLRGQGQRLYRGEDPDSPEPERRDRDDDRGRGAAADAPDAAGPRIDRADTAEDWLRRILVNMYAAPALNMAGPASRLLGGAASPGVDPNARAAVPQNTLPLARESYDFWRARGATPEGAASMVAQEWGESGFDWRNAAGDGGQARGAFQWQAPRRGPIRKATGIDVADPNTTHLQQLEAAHAELTLGLDPQAGRAAQAILQARTTAAGVRLGISEFERSKYQDLDFAKRLPRANEFLRLFHEQGRAPDARATAPSAAALAPPAAPPPAVAAQAANGQVNVDISHSNVPAGVSTRVRSEGPGVTTGLNIRRAMDLADPAPALVGP